MEGLYEKIELEIVSHLNALVNNDPENGDVLMFDVVALPQLQADYQRPFQHVRVTVAYKSSDFGEIKSTHHITQPEKIQIEVIIQSRHLRGVTGIHKFTDIVKRRLVGFRPTDCTKMYLVKNGFSDYNNESALWSYSLLFETTYTIVEDGEFELGPLFTQAFFEYNEENPAIPAVPFPGTQPNPPILAYKGDIAYWDGEVWRRLHPGTSGHVLATRGQGEVPEWVEPQAGAQGPQGPQGATGPGVASGGTTGQVLVKKSNTNFDTEWRSIANTWRHINSADSAPVTISASNVVVRSVLIPAGTLTANSVLKYHVKYDKENNDGAVNTLVDINTIDSLSGSTNISRNVSVANTIQFINHERDFACDGSNLKEMLFSANQQTPINQSSRASYTPINPAVDNWLLFNVRVFGATDILRMIYLEIEICSQ